MNLDDAVVVVTSSFPRSEDGSEAAGSFVRDLVEEISRHRPCRVVAPGRGEATETISSRLTVLRYTAPDQPLSTLNPWKIGELLSIVSVLGSGRATTLRAVQAGPTSRIIALWAVPGGHWARQASHETGIPYRVWTLGSDIWSLGKVPFLGRHIRRILRSAEACYADGLKLKDETSRIGDRPVSFLPSTRSIDTSIAQISRASPPYRFLFLGRWQPNKGIDLLMQALEQLDEEVWNDIESFSIFGGGPLENSVTASAERLKAAGRPVAVGGYLDKHAAEKRISESDWLVIPSRIESIPVIFSDAMKLSTPVIATPVGDLPELIRKHDVGILCESATGDGIRSGIRAALRASASACTPEMEELAQRFSLESSIVPTLLGHPPSSEI